MAHALLYTTGQSLLPTLHGGAEVAFVSKVRRLAETLSAPSNLLSLCCALLILSLLVLLPAA